MSVTSVLTGRSTPYPPISGNNAQNAKFAAPTRPSQENPATPAPGYADSADASQYQSALEQALRTDGATAPGATGGTSESDGSQQSPAGIALYKRISQIGTSEPSASELLRSWNNIMQSGQDAGDAGAATLQALLQSGAPASRSSILDVTA